ncbi:fasciclin-2-like protein [Babesia caballi]|uniref:Fasciclin-2-like protein n=1 Tax=Babesia caballi TaxID=5871 RepID=A0AAV4LZF0_BABCB|nr:fasciclin-2-like protein [Babesia caballi]
MLDGIHGTLYTCIRRLSHVVNTINWCPNGRLLAVTTEDGHVSLIDTFIDGPGKIRHFEGHTSFAQGVVICPKNMMVASMGQDQTLRIWKRRNEKQWKNILVLRSAKDRSEFKESIGMESDDVRYSRSVFMNEELSTFFRRLDWSPDGRFLVTPAGIRHNALFKKEEEPDTKSEPVYTLYVFHRKLIHLGIPMVTHQSPTGPFVVVKFCPLDIAKIQRDKIDFFSKLFSKGKNAKKKKTTPKKANSTSSAASSAKTTKKITEMCAAGGKASSEVREEAVGRQSVSNEETPVRLQDEQDVKEASETSVYSATAAETSTAAFANEGPAEDSSHVTVKPESSSPSQSSPNRVDDGGVQTREQSDESVSTKLEEVSTSAGLELNINNEQLEVPELDLLQTMDSVAIDCSAPTDRQEEAEGDDNGAECVPVRSSKRESRPPKYYEATLHETGATRKSSKPKSAKKDEDQEYDTDVEDEVVVPRLLFAAGTLDGSLCFYDTMENKGPVAVLKNLHYCTITDIAWSPDGFVCATASSDGYITFVVFQRKEFY